MHKVCIVEDDVDLTGAYQDAFESYGKVYQRFEPNLQNRTAAEVAAEIAAIDPDYVIIDACLGLKSDTQNDGIEVLRSLQNSYGPDTPRILLVTNTLDDVLTAYQEFNCIGYLPKNQRHDHTAMVAVQYIHTQPKKPLSPEKFFLRQTRVRDAGGGFIDIPANTFAKRVEGRWIFIPIGGPRIGSRPPLLLNELMAQPGRWVSLDSLKAQVAPAGLLSESALGVAAHEVRRCFIEYFSNPSPFLSPGTTARLRIELPERIETRAKQVAGARWLVEA